MSQKPMEAAVRPPKSRVWAFVRWLGALHPVMATLVLLGFTVLAAELCFAIVRPLLGVPDHPLLALGTAIITLLVGTPIIYASQRLIRELRAAQGKQKKLTQELAIALDRAEAASQSKAAQMAAMSHELRTPMNAIVGFSDILRHERFGSLQNAKYREYATDINDSALHLLGILNQLLDLAKIEAGGFDLQDAAAFDAADLAAQAARVVAPLAEREGVSLVLAAEEPGLRIHAVERMLRQVLLNLLSNAVKFTPAGGTVRLGVTRTAEGRVRLAVADSGIGMTPDEIRVAFMPFGQVKGQLSRRHAGTGLGLPLAKAMTELNGGTLDLQSSPGRGTTVTLEFPALPP